jgi:cell division protein FtsB
MTMLSYAEHQRLVKEASLGYEKRLSDLRDENAALKARVAELEGNQAGADAEPRGKRRG